MLQVKNGHLNSSKKKRLMIVPYFNPKVNFLTFENFFDSALELINKLLICPL